MGATKPDRLKKGWCDRVTAPGKYGEIGGHGLMLAVGASGSKSWVQKLRVGDRWTLRGLGSYRLVSLTEARDKAYVNWQAARNGMLETHARERRSEVRLERTVPTFAEAVDKYAETKRKEWSDRHFKQWVGRLRHNVSPALGTTRVDEITLEDLERVLKPLSDSRETAKKVRQGMFVVFEWTVAKGFRTANPVGKALDILVPLGRSKTTHRAALKHGDVAHTLSTIRESGAWAGAILALEFVALTAVRSGEARGATWDEIDGDTWTIPAERMKQREAHQVPLSSGALDVLRRARELTGPDGLVFMSVTGKRMQDAALGSLMRGTGGTVHGLRSTFQDWAIEAGYTLEETEPALAHAIGGNAVQRAYARTTMLDARRGLMQEWSAFLTA